MTVIARRFPGSILTPTSTPPAPIPSTLILAPGMYTYGGVVLDMRVEGAYSLWEPGVDRSYHIVWGGDVECLMASLAWLTAVGSSDASVPLSTLIAKMRWFKPRLLCGLTIDLARQICSTLGVETRVVRALTAGAPTNYFDGHVMLEARVAGQWRLFDLAGGLSFGARSLREALPLFPGFSVRMSEKSVAVEQIASSIFDPLVWTESTLSGSEQEQEWQRVLQIAGIDKIVGGAQQTWWRMTPEVAHRAAWVQSLSPSYVCKTPAEWDAAFY